MTKNKTGVIFEIKLGFKLSSIIPIRSNLPLERGGKSGIFSEDKRLRIKNKFPALGLDIILQMASDAAFQKEDMKITLFSL